MERRMEKYSRVQVEVVSRKLIRPSAPTPSHLRYLKLSFIDQFAPPVFVKIILYYPKYGGLQLDEQCAQLQKSLSETLTIFYPLAGRYKKGDLFVDCNDEGVEFLEARVLNGVTLAELLDGKLETELLDNFVPSNMGRIDSATTPFIFIQVNNFICGGLVVCLCMSHRIADGFTMAAFLDAWSTASQGGIAEVIPPIFDLGSHFPARLLVLDSDNPPPSCSRENMAKAVTRRFVFSGEAISALKAKIGCQTSRVQAVTAVIWRALLYVSRAKYGCSRTSLLEHSVNLRVKTFLQVTNDSFGNFYTLALPRIMQNEDSMIELQDLVRLMQDAISKITCNKTPSSDELFLMVSNSSRESADSKNNHEVDFRVFTSWCRFPFYEADFGWGKPRWVSSVSSPAFEITILIDTKDGDGIEAWVSLNEHDMIQFVEDQNIKTFSSH